MLQFSYMKPSLFILVSGTIILSLIPVLSFYKQASPTEERIVPLVVEDDHYYYARMAQVVAGHPSIGNPYFTEYKNEIAPAFFIPDWIVAAPALLGASFSATVAFNFVFWSLIFSLLMYALFREFGISSWWSAAGSLLAYGVCFSLILRPVIMQTIFPFFILFYIALIRWLKIDTPTFRDNLFLAVAAAIPFYLYAYLWQIVLVTLGITGLYVLYKKKFRQLNYLVLVILTAGALAVPIIISTVKQILHPYYWETVRRIALVETHVPTFFALYLVGIAALCMCLWYFSSRFIRVLQNDEEYQRGKLFSLLTGSSLVLVLLSNVITGKDMEISNHIDRFVSLWAVCTSLLYIYRIYKLRSIAWFEYTALFLPKKFSLIILFTISIIYSGQSIISGFTLPKLLRLDTKPQQEYVAPLEWLRKRECSME